MSAVAVVDVCVACGGEPGLFPCTTCKARQEAVVDAVSHGIKADPEFDLFIDACRHDAYTHAGFVAVNRVREALSNDHGLTVNPRRYSGFWRRAQLAGALSPPVSTEPSRDARSRNLAKESRIYRWLGHPTHR